MEEPIDIKRWRRAERERLLSQRIAAGRKARAEWSAAIERRLETLLAGLPCELLGFYWPFKGEFDARPLVRRLLARGLSAALPAVVEPKAPLEFRPWSPGVPMEPGVYKIPVPKERRSVVPDHLLVPVVGFDAEGYRLGYGGGYYDRTLATLVPRPFAIGVGFELSRLATIHPQPHDVPLDVIVTEKGAFWRGRPREEREEAACADGPPAVELASPVCYAGEGDPVYSGHMGAAELVALLNTLLEAERAGAKVASAFLKERRDPSSLQLLTRLRRDEAYYCARLAELVRRLGGEPSRKTGAFFDKALAVEGFAKRLSFLNRGQAWVVRKLGQELPRIDDPAVRTELREMLARHETNLARCEDFLAQRPIS